MNDADDLNDSLTKTELDRDSYKRQLEEFAAANETLRGKVADAEARAERAEALQAQFYMRGRRDAISILVGQAWEVKETAPEKADILHEAAARILTLQPPAELPPDPEIERLREAAKEIRSELTFFIGSYDAGSVQMDSEECPCVERGVEPHKFYEHWLGGIRAWLAKHGEER